MNRDEVDVEQFMRDMRRHRRYALYEQYTKILTRAQGVGYIFFRYTKPRVRYEIELYCYGDNRTYYVHTGLLKTPRAAFAQAALILAERWLPYEAEAKHASIEEDRLLMYRNLGLEPRSTPEVWKFYERGV